MALDDHLFLVCTTLSDLEPDAASRQDSREYERLSKTSLQACEGDQQ